MPQPRVLVSGAGVAGPGLATCFARLGWRCTVVERAPALRKGGQAVDFRGPVHRKVLDALDLWEAIRERRTRPRAVEILGRHGVVQARLPEVMMSGDVEILRGDLSALLFERSRPFTDYRFGERVIAVHDDESGAHVELAGGGAETFDLVVGADGLHSGVRALAFGGATEPLLHHGYRIATFAMAHRSAPDAAASLYAEPGRAVLLAPTSTTEARALLVYEGGPMDRATDKAGDHRRALREHFAGMGWRVPAILDALDAATDLYVDAIASVHIPRYACGRVVLLGDAAYGGTLGGQGTSLAIVGAYVLSGELARGDGYAAAFARYEAKMRPYATRCQKGAARAGSFFAPRSASGLWMRNTIYGVLASRPMRGLFERLVKDAATDFVLPEYTAAAAGLTAR